jgi:hypothetical protein
MPQFLHSVKRFIMRRTKRTKTVSRIRGVLDLDEKLMMVSTYTRKMS